MRKSRTATLIDELCKKLQCVELAEDLARFDQAREMLAELQQQKVFQELQGKIGSPRESQGQIADLHKVSNFMPKTKKRLEAGTTSRDSMDEECVQISDKGTEKIEEEGEMKLISQSSDDAWLGYFRGFEVLDANQPHITNENKQCIELCPDDDSSLLEHYLRQGIRCFMIDLFVGTGLEIQELIFKLRESELSVSREFGFPISSSLIAMISPRLQYTGIMDPINPNLYLEKDKKIILTTNRRYTLNNNSDKVYVNARFLIDDFEKGDFILVGPSLQLSVLDIKEDELNCLVMEPGPLSSRMPVRFPAKCKRSQISLEELEDITFAREVGIHVIVSYKPGTREYFQDLLEALKLLKSHNIRLFARLVINEYDNDNRDLEWIAQSYDGFLLDFSVTQATSFCENEENHSKPPDLLKLSSVACEFIKNIYEMRKPIILQPSVIAQRQLFVKPCNVSEIFYYPDKYVFSTHNYSSAFHFNLLQNAMSQPISLTKLAQKYFCDSSNLGEQSIARACIAASYDSQAKVILVCSERPDMSIQLSHFRPNATIVLISTTKSLADYISLYHNIVFLYYKNRDNNRRNYMEHISNLRTFGVLFLRTRNIVKEGDSIILVYGTKPGLLLCDKYQLYKFNDLPLPIKFM